MSNLLESVGGFHALELPIKNNGIYSDGVYLQSARAALYLFLKNSKTKTIYLPEYICDSIIPAIESLNIKIIFYNLNQDFSPNISQKLKHEDFILIVNYFGLIETIIDKFLCTHPNLHQQIIIDNSQALFSPPKDCAATIYSPRKFLAMPDGGILITNKKIKVPRNRYNSEDFTSHLLLRTAGEQQKGYLKYQEAERGLSNFLPKQMSSVSNRLLISNDLEKIRSSRIRNYNLYNKEFSELNHFCFEPSETEIPLCYPLKLNLDVESICDALSRKGLFLARYWPNSINSSSDFARDIFKKTLFIPIDERITEQNCKEVVKIIKNQLDSVSQ